MLAYIKSIIQPWTNALFLRGISWKLRWTLLRWAPFAGIINSMTYLPWVFSRAYTVVQVPSTKDSHKIRTIVFQPKYSPSSPSPSKPRPLHVAFPGGSFMSGLAEYRASWANFICKSTGAVVVCASYRGSPQHTFPAGHDDVEDILAYYLKPEVAKKYNIDTNNVAVSGFSAGANLAISSSFSQVGRIKGSVTFYTPFDLRIPPWEKPFDEEIKNKDPMAFMLPLYDYYAGKEREKYLNNKRLHTTLAPFEDFPKKMLFFVPTIDPLYAEQLVFFVRYQKEIEETDRKIEIVVYPGNIHGWADIPDFALDTTSRTSYTSKITRDEAFEKSVKFLKELYAEGGWSWSA